MDVPTAIQQLTIDPSDCFYDLAQFAGLSDSIQAAVPSHLGFELSLLSVVQPVTFNVWQPHAEPGDIVTSLHLPAAALTGQTGSGGLIFWAGEPGALVDLAADLTYALRVSVGTIVLDEDLAPTQAGNTVTGATEASHVNQAIGILIAQGYAPDQAHTQLTAAADTQHLPVAVHARQFVRSFE